MDPIRRVITGHDARGRAVVLDDQPVEPVTLGVLPGFETFELWHTEGVPTMPDDLGAAGVPRYFPGPGGTVCRVVTFPPESTSELAPGFDFAAGIEEAQAKVPDLLARLEPDDPGMHATDSVDYGIVLSGELEMELDDGVTQVVRPGTVVVQRGTRHAWRNRTEQPARVAFVLVGATPVPG
jgi:mannose-6-phosphate isomerase-like protein (cupin superfamily)